MFNGRDNIQLRVDVAATGQELSLSGGVEVFGLALAAQLVLVARQAAEEDGAADAEDGGAPAEAVGPGVVVVALEDLLVELDGVDDESDDLEDHCRETRREKVSGNLRVMVVANSKHTFFITFGGSIRFKLKGFHFLFILCPWRRIEDYNLHSGAQISL